MGLRPPLYSMAGLESSDMGFLCSFPSANSNASLVYDISVSQTLRNINSSRAYILLS